MSNTKAVVFYLLARVSIRLPFYFMLWMADYVYTLYRIASRSDVKTHLSVPFSNAIFRGIIATERCCFAQLLKVVHSVSDRCFLAPLRKAIWYGVNVGLYTVMLQNWGFAFGYHLSPLRSWVRLSIRTHVKGVMSQRSTKSRGFCLVSSHREC